MLRLISIVAVSTFIAMEVASTSLKDDCLKGIFDPNENILAAVASYNQSLQIAIANQASVLTTKLEHYCMSEKDKLKIKNCVASRNDECTICPETTKQIDQLQQEIKAIINSCKSCVQEQTVLTQNFIFNLCVSVDCKTGDVKVVAEANRAKRSPSKGDNKSGKGPKGNKGDSNNKETKENKGGHKGSNGQKWKHHRDNLKSNLQIQACASFYAQIEKVYSPWKSTCNPGLDATTCGKYEEKVIAIADLIIHALQSSARCIDGITSEISAATCLEGLHALCTTTTR